MGEEEFGREREGSKVVVGEPKDRFENMEREGGVVKKLSYGLCGKINGGNFLSDDTKSLGTAKRYFHDVTWL